MLGVTDSVTVMVCVMVRLVNCYGNIMGQGKFRVEFGLG